MVAPVVETSSIITTVRPAIFFLVLAVKAPLRFCNRSARFFCWACGLASTANIVSIFFNKYGIKISRPEDSGRDSLLNKWQSPVDFPLVVADSF